MRILKPIRLSCIHRPYRYLNKDYLGVSAFVLVDFSAGDQFRLRTEQELWQLFERVAVKDFGAELIDMGIPKKQPEVVVSGYGYGKYAIDGRTAVQLKVANVKKELWITGDRRWEGGRFSKAEDFEQIPISWANAFGGAADTKNPIGKGLDYSEKKGINAIWLPNIESPNNPVTQKNKSYLPQSFSMLPIEYEGRNLLLGTYDEKWRREEFPGFASDIDWSYFNSAPVDQRLSHLNIADKLSFLNLHPEKQELITSIPPLKIRFFYKYQQGSQFYKDESLSEDELKLMTYWAFPSEEMAILSYQGNIPISEDDAQDISHLFFAIEHVERPKTTDYYKGIYKLRTEPQVGGLYSLLDSQVVDKEFIQVATHESIVVSKLVTNKLARGQKELDKEKKELLNRLNLSEEELKEHIKKDEELTATDKSRLAELFKEQSSSSEPLDFEASVRKQIALVESQPSVIEQRRKQKKALEESTKGIDAKVEQRSSTENKEFFNEYYEETKPQLKAVNLTIHTEGMAEEVEQEFAEQYRQNLEKLSETSAHQADQLSLKKSSRTNKIKSDFDCAFNKSLDEGDYFYVEGATLSDSSYANQSLKSQLEVVNSVFTYVEFTKSNLAGASFKSCEFKNCDFSSVILNEADFVNCKFENCTLHDVQCFNSKFLGSQFLFSTLSNWVNSKLLLDQLKIEDCKIESLVFIRSALSDVFFNRCQIKRSGMIRGRASKLRYEDSDIDSLGFIALKKIINLNLLKVNLEKFFIQQGTVLLKAKIYDSSIKHSSFREVYLEELEIQDSNLSNNDFSSATFDRTKIDDVFLKNGLFIRAEFKSSLFKKSDFAMSLFKKAIFENSFFSQSSFFSADMPQVQRDIKTVFENCLLERANFLPRLSEGVAL